MGEIIKWLLITLLPAITLGVIVGIVLGKYRLKQLRGEAKPVLTTPQRIIYLSSVAIGLACVMFAIFFNPKTDDGFAEGDYGEMGGFEGDYYGDPDIDMPFGGEVAVDGVIIDGVDMDDGEWDDEDGDGEEAAGDDAEADLDTDDADAPAFSAEGNGNGGDGGGTDYAVEVYMEPAGGGRAVRVG